MHDGRRFTTLASFDPHSLMLRFHEIEVGDPEGALTPVPTSTLAHELVHLSHTLGTASGIREFLMSIEDHQLRFAVLSRYLPVRGRDDDFVLPVISDLDGDRVETTNTATELAIWSRLLDVWSLYTGLESVEERDSEHLPNFWLEAEATVAGRPIPWELACANLYRFTGEGTIILPGYRQLTEGCAKVVERIQRRLANEEGDLAPAGLSHVDIRDFIRSSSSPYDPYLIAHMAFSEAKQMFAPSSSVGAYEEYVLVLADIAMMIDPLMTPDATTSLFGIRDADTLTTMKDGYTPFATYLRLCRIFWEISESLPGFGDCDRMTEDVVNIQDALLSQVAPSLTMQEVTRELRSKVEEHRELLSAHVIDDTPGIGDLFLNSFDNALQFREEVLMGGAFAEDFLTGRSKLEELARWMSPTYSVGGYVFSSYEPHKGFGVGVDLNNLEMSRDFFGALFWGNRSCPLAGDESTPRVCSLEPVSLCNRLPTEIPEARSPTYCVREQTVRFARGFGLERLNWRS